MRVCKTGSAGDRLPPTPTEPTPHREGHGPRFLRVCVRLPPDTASQAGEQDFDEQYGVRFTPSGTTVRVQGSPEGDEDGYIWTL